MKKDVKRLKLTYRLLQLIAFIGWAIEMIITAKVGRLAFRWLPLAMLPLTALAALAVKVFYKLPKEEKANVRIFSPSLLTSHPVVLLFMMISINLAALYFSTQF